MHSLIPSFALDAQDWGRIRKMTQPSGGDEAQARLETNKTSSLHCHMSYSLLNLETCLYSLFLTLILKRHESMFVGFTYNDFWFNYVHVPAYIWDSQTKVDTFYGVNYFSMMSMRQSSKVLYQGWEVRFY